MVYKTGLWPLLSRPLYLHIIPKWHVRGVGFALKVLVLLDMELRRGQLTYTDVSKERS
jgi:hypothetical protein